MGNRTQLDANVITYAFAIPLGLLGLFAYGITLYIINKSPRYRNAFGILFTAYISFHIQTLSALLLWTIIRIIVNLGFTSFPWHIFIRIASPISNSTLYAAIWMHFVLAINRLWAISYPMKYHRIFNPKNAWITVISLWSFSMLITLLYYNGIRFHHFKIRYSNT
uniref:Bm13512 n=1 Tax=Brugia malayi TaxID=6279 RepID=A0A1I9G6Y9_BRUMA|nr:Bm13512 [Brugia malayi]